MTAPDLNPEAVEALVAACSMMSETRLRVRNNADLAQRALQNAAATMSALSARVVELEDANTATRTRLVEALDERIAAERRAEEAEARQQNGSRPLPFARDELGRMVREAWVRWAQTQPHPKPSWLVPYDELSEPDKEADRQIGEALARWTLIGDAALAALRNPDPDEPGHD